MNHPTSIQDLAAYPDPSPQAVGGKGIGLLQLGRLGLEGVPAWVIPAQTFTAHIASLGLEGELKALSESLGTPDVPRGRLEALRQGILAAPLPEELLRSIRTLQDRLAADFGEKIIIRSSATVEDSAHRSFAGIFESIPCRTDEEVQTALKRVWASVFSPRAFAYYGIAGLRHFPAMAVILQPFIEADRAGVMFTHFSGPDPKAPILVEHVAGGGEKLVTGKVNPDRLWLPDRPDETGLPETGDLPQRIAQELIQAALTLEHELGPQDVEWCLYADRLFIVQTRPITAGGEDAPAPAGGEVILQGVAASQGRAGGAVHLVFNIEDADALETGQVLTTTMTNPDMVPSMQRSAAIVTDVGGMICHAAIVSRELGVPCVVGTKFATQTLEQGSVITVDGSAGVVLRGLFDAPVSATTRALQWSDLWQAWASAVPANTLPILSTLFALASVPAEIEECVIDPTCDLALDPRIEIEAMAALPQDRRTGLLRAYLEQLSHAAPARLKTLFVDLRRLPEELGAELGAMLSRDTRIRALTPRGMQAAWSVQVDPAGHSIAQLDGYTPDPHTAPSADRIAIPLGFGLLLNSGPFAPPEAPAGGPGGMFGMMPEIRMAQMPARERRERMHALIPALSAAHGGQISVSDQVFPWVDLRPEVVISPYLKAFVTPGVESAPYVMGFPDPPLHVQFIRCRFHFRQDTLFGFFPKLMQMTWDEAFLSDLLQRCRASYENLETRSSELPQSEAALAQANDAEMTDRFVAWWNAFSEFFSLSFFIQAQGDDCVFPALGKLAEGNNSLLKNSGLEVTLPGVAELSAPVTPVLTAEYMRDMLALNTVLRSHGLEALNAALEALESGEPGELRDAFDLVHARWHWMRERDPYYDPYDTPEAILEKSLAIRSAAASDYEVNKAQAALALALHFDLGRITGTSEKIIYCVKYGRALAIDRENHHIVWLRTSYRLRQMLMEWERRLQDQNDLLHRDIFFMTPWEIIDTIPGKSQPMPAELLARVRNRRAAYEREIQLKAGRVTPVEPEPEEDYF